MGLVVDKVNEVANIPADQIEPAPQTGHNGSLYIQGIGKAGDEIKILLDVNRLLGTELTSEPGAAV
jgi:purine-binding chemotaxis protein CheW